MHASRLTWFYLSLDGRIGRSDFWLYLMIPTAVLILPVEYAHDFNNSAVENVLVIVLLWPSIAVQAKRWHDRDKSGWWILINFVPIIGTIISLVENGFLPGTKGENRFGPDPLDAHKVEARL